MQADRVPGSHLRRFKDKRQWLTAFNISAQIDTFEINISAWLFDKTAPAQMKTAAAVNVAAAQKIVRCAVNRMGRRE